MRKNILLVPAFMLAFLMVIFTSGCDLVTGDFGEKPLTSNDLKLMLRASPSDTEIISYVNIPLILEGQEVPPQQISTSQEEDWWPLFQSLVLANLPFNGIPELWALNRTDIQGILNLPQPKPRLVIVSGTLDTIAFRLKMKEYGYSEERYLDYYIIYGIPRPSGELDENSAGMMPRAYGVIDEVKDGEDNIDLIIMCEDDETTNPIIAKNRVKDSLDTFHENITDSRLSNWFTDIIDSPDKVSSAFLTNRSLLKEVWEKHCSHDVSLAEDIKQAVGPGELGTYNDYAIISSKDADSYLIEYVLAFDSLYDAEINIDKLQSRLYSGRSVFWEQELSDLWTIRDIKAEGKYLHSIVELKPDNRGYYINTTSMVYLPDYWFLYPGHP